jgi:hypothetical protein
MQPRTFWALAVVVVVTTVWLAWPRRNDDDDVSPAQVEVITASDLQAVRSLGVVWAPMEAGAPAVYGTVALELDEDTYRRAIVAAEILMHLGKLLPGRYAFVLPNSDDWAPYLEHGFAKVEGRRVTFDVTEQHLVLLDNARAEVIDKGAFDIGVSINPKRPYGDMTHFPIDMGAILDIPPTGPIREDYPSLRQFSDEQLTRLYRLHEETQPTLQIFLQHAVLEPGRFVRGPQDGVWHSSP